MVIGIRPGALARGLSGILRDFGWRRYVWFCAAGHVSCNTYVRNLRIRNTSTPTLFFFLVLTFVSSRRPFSLSLSLSLSLALSLSRVASPSSSFTSTYTRVCSSLALSNRRITLTHYASRLFWNSAKPTSPAVHRTSTTTTTISTTITTTTTTPSTLLLGHRLRLQSTSVSIVCLFFSQCGVKAEGSL